MQTKIPISEILSTDEYININYEKSTQEQIADLLKFLKTEYTILKTTNFEDELHVIEYVRNTENKNVSFDKIKKFQLFIDKDDDNTSSIEITIDPDQLISDITFEEFSYFVAKCAEALSSQIYFVRHESISWEFGDTGENSGIIFSFEDISINEILKN